MLPSRWETTVAGTIPCLAVAAVRRAIGRAPFGYLHRLQQRFFSQGMNINDAALLTEQGDTRSLIAGGYADAATLEAMIRARLSERIG